MKKYCRQIIVVTLVFCWHDIGVPMQLDGDKKNMSTAHSAPPKEDFERANTKIIDMLKSIKSSLARGLVGSAFAGLVPDIQCALIQSITQPLNLKCVNKDLNKAITQIGVRNILRVYWACDGEHSKAILLNEYVPVVLLEKMLPFENNYYISTPYHQTFNWASNDSFVDVYQAGSLGSRSAQLQDQPFDDSLLDLHFIRTQQACAGKDLNIDIISNHSDLSAVLGGNIDALQFKISIYKLHDLIGAAIMYPSGDEEILNYLIQKLAKENSFLNPSGYDQHASCFYNLLLFARKYNNARAFKALVFHDPYHFKNKNWGNYFGLDLTFLDRIKCQGWLDDSALEILREGGYSETYRGTVAAIGTNVMRKIIFGPGHRFI